MKYFFDTEFLEGFKKPISWLPTIGGFNKPYHSIQLISIGIVNELGYTYYAISNEFNPNDASDWVKENVLSKLPSPIFNGSNIKDVKRYKSNKQIAADILDYIWSHTVMKIDGKWVSDEFVNPEFYAYYADYDWVVFCSLFGTMMDLPKGFPMYCRDLKQTIDEVAETKIMEVDEKTAGVSRFEASLSLIKVNPKYPETNNEHNALYDAKWNFELYKFLQTL